MANQERQDPTTLLSYVSRQKQKNKVKITNSWSRRKIKVVRRIRENQAGRVAWGRAISFTKVKNIFTKEKVVYPNTIEKKYIYREIKQYPQDVSWEIEISKLKALAYVSLLIDLFIAIAAARPAQFLISLRHISTTN